MSGSSGVRVYLGGVGPTTCVEHSCQRDFQWGLELPTTDSFFVENDTIQCSKTPTNNGVTSDRIELI